MGHQREDREILRLKKALDELLNDKKSIHAPCENAYKDDRDGRAADCTCWRCRPDWV